MRQRRRQVQMKIEVSGCMYEDREALETFTKARDLYGMVWNASEKIRQRLKHELNIGMEEARFLEELWEDLDLSSLGLE